MIEDYNKKIFSGDLSLYSNGVFNLRGKIPKELDSNEILIVTKETLLELLTEFYSTGRIHETENISFTNGIEDLLERLKLSSEIETENS